jgi:hypothetical protein
MLKNGQVLRVGAKNNSVRSKEQITVLQEIRTFMLAEKRKKEIESALKLGYKLSRIFALPRKLMFI